MRIVSTSLGVILFASACTSHGTSATTGSSKEAGADTGAQAHTDAALTPADALPSTSHGQCTGALKTVGTPVTTTVTPPALSVASGFKLEVIATIAQPRQLVALPNGDLLVGTTGTDVYLVPNAEASGLADAPVLFTSVADSPVQGVAFLQETCAIAVAAQHGVYSVAYSDGQTTAALGAAIAKIRTGPVAHSVDASVDTDTHTTTSVTYAGGELYASVGSSCNACVEVDPTRGTIQEMNVDGTGMTMRAARIRNAIAVTTNPATGTVWAGGAGQDDLTLGHPYEYFDAVTLHPGVADYGWPFCEENQHAYVAGADCSNTVVPLIELPAYSTLIGATFYPLAPTGAYAFPEAYRGGVFVTAHGSWHTNTDGTLFSAPRVAYVAMNGDSPVIPADWSDPTAQWVDFIGGFQLANGSTRIGRPTGVAVGVQGSLFVADDRTNEIYRVRPQ